MFIHIKEWSKDIDNSTICNLNPFRYQSHLDPVFQLRNTLIKSNSAYLIKVFFIKIQNISPVFIKKKYIGSTTVQLPIQVLIQNLRTLSKNMKGSINNI